MSEFGIRLVTYGQTDVGKMRGENEDAFAICDARTGEFFTPTSIRPIDIGQRPTLLAVADGMGGENAGEVASTLALNVLCSAVSEQLGAHQSADALLSAVEQANDRVAQEASQPDREGMGATLVAVLLDGPQAYVVAVGDSRVYLLRAGHLVQLTKDQSVLQYLLENEQIDPEDAERFPYANMILQAIGRAPSLSVPMSRVSLRRGDRLLLCSDGLSNELDDHGIRDHIHTEDGLDLIAKRLIDEANHRGGRDNITVVLALVDGDCLPEPLPAESLEDTVVKLISYRP